jgi:electron-transferring-flavoprotein dehydrogenase
LPRAFHAPGLLLCGDGVGLVNVPALKGIHYALESGRLAAEAAYRALQKGEAVGRRGALQSYDDSIRESYIWKDLKRVRNVRPAFSRGFWFGSALAGGAITSFGKLPPKDETLELDTEQELLGGTGRAAAYPPPDGKLTFDKLSSVFASGNKTRDDQPSHIRIETRVPRDLAEMWARLCPAHVYEVGHEDAGKVSVQVTPSNCVQCGAITAKGGRLTPPEGGSGPEYTLT